MKPRTKLIANGLQLLAATALSLAAPAWASSVGLGVNWVNDDNGGVQNGDADSLVATDIAGAPGYAQANWNNLGRWGDNVTLVDSAGAGSGVLVAWDATGVWNNGASTATGDGKMMNGYLDSNGYANTTWGGSVFGANNDNKPVAFFSGISAWMTAIGACSYDVVIYASGDGAGRVGQYWLVNAPGSASSGWNTLTLGANLATPVFMKAPAPFSGTYTRVPLTSTAGATAATGNYVVFTNLTADSFLLRTEEYNTRAPINGVQIWAHVSGAPTINSNPSSQTNYGGQTVQLSFAATACVTPTFQWRAGASGSGVFTNVPNGGNISGANSSTLTISNITLANAADYVLVAMAGGLSATSAVATVSVVPAFITAGPTPADEVLYQGATAHFRATVQATAPTLTWRTNGVPLTNGGRISGAATNALSIANVQAGDAANYDLVVSTAYGSITSSVATLSVLAAPAVGSFAESVITNHALGYWRFGELAGPTAYDHAGGFNGTYLSNSSPAQMGPQPADFLGFEGTNISVGINPGLVVQDQSWVTIPSLNMVTNAITIVAWVYPLQNQQAWTGILMTRSGIAGGLGFSGTANELAYTWNNDTTWIYHSGLIVPNNMWSMVAMVMTPANTTLYVGNPSSGLISWFNPQTNIVQNWTGSAMIGDDQDGTGRAYVGMIDEVAVFDHSLSPAAILSLYAAGRAAGVLPPTITAQPVSEGLYPGRNARFAVTASGTAPLTYQWRKNGTPLSDGGNVSGATSSGLTLTAVAAGDVASYDLVVTNSAGSVTSSVAALTLIAPTGAGYEAAVMAAAPLAYWRLNEAFGSVNAFDLYGGFTGTYGVNTTAGAVGPESPEYSGFEALNTGVTLYQNGADSWVAVPPLNVNTNTMTITAWIYPASNNQTNAGIFYQRQGLTVAGLAYDNFDGTRLGYNWNDAAGAYNFDSGLYIPPFQWSFVAVVVEPTKATLYLYTTNAQYAAANVRTHPNQDFAGPSYIGNDTFSSTGARTFNGTIDEVAVWKRALTSEQIAALYTAASGTLFAPKVTAQPASQTVYAGMNAQFNAAAAGSATLKYQWLKNGAPVADGGVFSGATTPSLSLTGVALGDAGNYAVVVTNVLGAVTSQVATLTVLPASARIAWSAPALITTADATLTQPGSVVGAAVFGNLRTVVTLTGGTALDFKSDGSVASTTGNGTSTGAFDPNTSGNLDFDAVLNQFNYDGGPKTITVKGLIPGHQYAVQLFGLDNRPSPPENIGMSRRAYFQDPYDTNAISATFYMSNNVYVIGSFTAVSTNQLIREVLPGLDGGTAQVGNGNLNALVLRDLSAAPTITAHPASVTRYPGAPAAFSAVTYGATPMYYQWQRATGSVYANYGAPGTISLPETTTVTLSIPAVTLADAANYRLVVTNSSGAATSQVATLTVPRPPASGYASVAMSYGPVAYWRFNEPGGSTVSYDYVGANDAANTAVVLGGTGPLVAGLEPANTAATFDGVASASSTAVSLMNHRAQFTLAGWIKLAAAPAARAGLFGQNDVAEFGFHNTTSMGIWSPSGGYLEFPIASLVLGQWHHVAVVADGTQFQLYLDGVLQASGGNSTTDYGSSSYPFRIGGGGILDTSGNYFNGSIDEVAVFGYALTAEQIANLVAGAAPVVLRIDKVGTQVQLTWPQGTLLEASDVTGPWTTNTAASPCTLTPSEARKFYRVIVR